MGGCIEPVITATLILVGIFLSYPIYVVSRWGVLTSISASSYRLKGNAKALFMGWLVLVGIGSYFLDMGFWSHLMAVGFCISGMSPDHKRRPSSVEDEYHAAGTVLAVVASFVGLFLTYGLWQPAVVFGVGTGVLYFIRTNWIWWVEVLAMCCIAGGLLIGT